jgi:hypothetical protein
LIITKALYWVAILVTIKHRVAIRRSKHAACADDRPYGPDLAAPGTFFARSTLVLIVTLRDFANLSFIHLTYPFGIISERRGARMKIVRMILIALLVWSAAGTSEATARRARRDAVRTNCLLQALQRFPAATAGAEMKSKRNVSYKACMAAAGRRQ